MSTMAQNHSFGQTLAYTRTLFQAGITGLRTNDAGANHRPEFAAATRGALKTAGVLAGVAVLTSDMRSNPKRAIRNALTVAGVTFCADFCRRSRLASRSMFAAVHKQISNARDQHWLEQNPVDYA